MYDNIKRFRFWCQKVLPLVYDDSLSYYEVLCKVVKYINDLIEQDKIVGDELAKLQKEMVEVRKWVDTFDTKVITDIVNEHIATMIFVGISESGYIVYDMPESWNDIVFNTTGLDIELDMQPDYGHLVLSY